MRVGIDPEPMIDEVVRSGRGWPTARRRRRIFINLERRTPPAAFRVFGPRLVPTFNYFQTAIVLAADGTLDVDGRLPVWRAH